MDTGFDRDLIVPASLPEGIQPVREMPYRLIDGTQGSVFIFNGYVQISDFAPILLKS